MGNKEMTAKTSVAYGEIMRKTFQERFLAAVILLVVVFLSVQYLPDIGFFSVLQLVILVSLVEFYNLFRETEYPYYKILGIFIALMMSASFLFESVTLEMVLLCGLFMAAAFSLLFVRKFETLAPFASAMALTLVGPLYVNLTVNHVYLLRMERGAYYIYFLILVIVCGDSGAYFIGKFWGRHLLAPKVSPRKTWEGSLGGLVCAGLGAVFVQQVLITPMALWKAVLVAFLVHVVAQLSDLLESLFKRAAGKKDSSSVLGGHGGFLDRLDSFILAAPFFYYLLKVIRLS